MVKKKNWVLLSWKELPKKQFKAKRSNWDSCQLITLKRGNSSNSLDFKEVYSLYRFTEIYGMAHDFCQAFAEEAENT